jgi:hypothetical protein
LENSQFVFLSIWDTNFHIYSKLHAKLWFACDILIFMFLDIRTGNEIFWTEGQKAFPNFI